MADDMSVKCVAVAADNKDKQAERLSQQVDRVIEETLHVIRNIGGDAQQQKCATLASEP